MPNFLVLVTCTHVEWHKWISLKAWHHHPRSAQLSSHLGPLRFCRNFWRTVLCPQAATASCSKVAALQHIRMFWHQQNWISNCSDIVVTVASWCNAECPFPFETQEWLPRCAEQEPVFRLASWWWAVCLICNIFVAKRLWVSISREIHHHWKEGCGTYEPISSLDMHSR